MQEVTIVDMDGEAGVILPEAIVQRWQLKAGDEVECVMEHGGLIITVPPLPSRPQPDRVEQP